MKYFLLASICAAFIACSSEDTKAIKFSPGDSITLKSYDNKSITLKRTEHGFIDAAHPKNALLIDVFGTFCPPCRKEAPDLFDLASKQPELTLIGLSYAEKASDERLKEFATSFNAFYFLSNDAKNEAIVKQITDDIDYASTPQLPFKVLLKNGEYQKIGDNLYLLGLDRNGVLSPSINAAINTK